MTQIRRSDQKLISEKKRERINEKKFSKAKRMRLNIKFQLKREEILASIRLLSSSTLPHCIPSRFSHFLSLSLSSFFCCYFFYLRLVFARGSSTSFLPRHSPIIHFCCPLADLYCSILYVVVVVRSESRKMQEQSARREREWRW